MRYNPPEDTWAKAAMDEHDYRGPEQDQGQYRFGLPSEENNG